MTVDAREQVDIGPGSKVGRFVVVGELGSGGMGVVYAAHDRELDRQVALKVMRVASVEEEDRVRMLREGQAMARITHPNVITVFEVGSEAGIVFLAQELLDGGTLGNWLEKPRPHDEILRKFIVAGRGLAAAHAAGLVHRDFKPDNVLLGKDGRVRVADFGLARELGGPNDIALMATTPGGGPPEQSARAHAAAAEREAAGVLSRNLTRTGVVMGTPMFMAPEQHEGRGADERSDQFAFCVALYQALYGDWPFAGKTAVSLADNVINGVMQKPPASAKVPARLRKVLLRGLATKPADRHPTMTALLEELGRRPSAGRTITLLVGGVLVLGAGAAASIAILGREPAPAPATAMTTEESSSMAKIPANVRDREVDPRALSEALDNGQLENARRKFDDDALLIRDPAEVSRARSAAALMLVINGDLRAAEAKLKEAGGAEITAPAAVGYRDMAGAAIASARGELEAAFAASQRCLAELGAADPIASSICHQFQGEVEADRGDAAAARRAYDAGLSLARGARDPQRIGELSLAIAQLELDEKQENVSLDAIATLQKDARRRGAVSCEANAAVLGARIRLTKADPQGAIDVFEDVNPDVLQAYRTKLIANITIGQIYGYRGEADEDGVLGLTRIDNAREDAQKRGFVGLVLEARLASVLVKLITGADGVETERASLIRDATAKGYKRIARLAAVDFSRDATPAELPPP